MNDFENKIKGVLKKEVEKPLSYDYAIKNAFYNSKNKRKSNLLLKLATTTSCLIMICTGVFATSYIVYEKVWKKPVIVNQEEENSNVEKEISKEEKENYISEEDAIKIANEVINKLDYKNIQISNVDLKRKYNIKLNNINSSSYWSLIKALEHGIGIHHGKFPKYIQNEILRLFNNGTFNYLFCTSTIIEGVNTNARNIVILNNSVGRSELTSFALKNIKGRAGRYYHNNIGRIFYTDKKQRQIEATNNMNLNFQTYDDIEILNCDIDNADLCDLGFKNKIIKRTREEKFDKLKLPDDVFIKNRLIERDIQEKYLEFLLQYENFEQFSSLISDSGNIHSFISNSMINKILDSFVKVGILDEANYNRYCAILVTYCKKGTTGLLDYQVKKLLKNGEKFSDVNMDSAYIITFEQIRNIIEYEVPKILCLFEALYKQAGKLMQKNMDDFNMSSIIRYYELGIMTELGLFLVEYGFPVDTIRNIEHKYPIISNLSALEASNYINEHAELLNVILDPYEIDLYNRAMVILEKRNK